MNDFGVLLQQDYQLLFPGLKCLVLLRPDTSAAMLNYACEAGEAGQAGDSNTAAFPVGGPPR